MSGSRQNQLAGSNPLARRGNIEAAYKELAPIAQASGMTIERTENSIRLDGFTLTESGLTADEGITVEQWNAMGFIFKQFMRRFKWWVGDWINAANTEWGDKYRAAQQLTGLKYGSLRNLAMVCNGINLSLRGDKLTPGHGKVLVPLAEDAKEWFAQQTELNSWSVKTLEAAILDWKGERRPSKPAQVYKQVRALSRALKHREPIKTTDVQALRDLLAQVEASGLLED